MAYDPTKPEDYYYNNPDDTNYPMSPEMQKMVTADATETPDVSADILSGTEYDVQQDTDVVSSDILKGTEYDLPASTQTKAAEVKIDITAEKAKEMDMFDVAPETFDIEEQQANKKAAFDYVKNLPYKTPEEKATRDQMYRNIMKWYKTGMEDARLDAMAEALSNAHILTNSNSIYKAMTNIIDGFLPDALINSSNKEYMPDKNPYIIAGNYLIDNGIIEEYDFEQKTVTLPNGTVKPFDTTFLSDLEASKFATIYGAVGGTAVGMAATATVGTGGMAAPFLALAGEVISSMSGSSRDYMEAANFFGVEPTMAEIGEAMVYTGVDNAMLAPVAAVFSRVVGTGVVPEKIKRISNSLINNDLNGAWDNIKTLTGKTDEELDDMITKATDLWGEQKLDINTNAGKIQAIKFIALYDNSLEKYTANALKTSTAATENIMFYLSQKTKDLKEAVVGGNGQDIVFNASDLYTQSGKNWGKMKENMDASFEGVPITSQPLAQKLEGVLNILTGMQGKATEAEQVLINNVIDKANKIDSIGGIIDLHKTYNDMFTAIEKRLDGKGGAQTKILLEGKKSISKYILDVIDSNPLLTSSAKKDLKEEYTKANLNASIIKDAINSDFYDAVVTARKNIKPKDDVLDEILYSAKTTKLTRDINEAEKMLNLLEPEKLIEVEKSLINRIVNKSVFDKDRPDFANFNYIAQELQDVKHIFKSKEAKDIIAKLEKFSSFWEADPMLASLSKIMPEEKLFGAGLSYKPTTSALYAAGTTLFKKLQIVMPAIIREFGLSKLFTPFSLGDKMTKASRTASMELNIANALDEAVDLPNFLTVVLRDNSESLSEPIKTSMQQVLKDYAKMAESYNQLLPEERQKALDAIEEEKYMRSIKETTMAIDRAKRTKRTGEPIDYDALKEKKLEELKQARLNRIGNKIITGKISPNEVNPELLKEIQKNNEVQNKLSQLEQGTLLPPIQPKVEAPLVQPTEKTTFWGKEIPPPTEAFAAMEKITDPFKKTNAYSEYFEKTRGNASNMTGADFIKQTFNSVAEKNKAIAQEIKAKEDLIKFFEPQKQNPFVKQQLMNLKADVNVLTKEFGEKGVSIKEPAKQLPAGKVDIMQDVYGTATETNKAKMEEAQANKVKMKEAEQKQQIEVNKKYPFSEALDKLEKLEGALKSNQLGTKFGSVLNGQTLKAIKKELKETGMVSSRFFEKYTYAMDTYKSIGSRLEKMYAEPDLYKNAKFIDYKDNLVQVKMNGDTATDMNGVEYYKEKGVWKKVPF